MSIEPEGEDSSFWGVPASTGEAAEATVKAKFSLFHRVIVEGSEIVSPFAWWKANEHCYPIVDFFTKQHLGIPGSQIETERIFNIARMLISLQQSRLGTKNLDHLIMIYKNWPASATSSSVPLAIADMHEFFAIETDLVDVCEVELQEGDQFESIPEEEEDDISDMW